MRRFRSKTLIVMLCALVAAIAAWNWRATDPRALREMREVTFDTYQRFLPRKALGQPIRVIDIDEASIARYGQWPWPRTQIAEIVDRLREYGALTVAFDIVFSEPDRTGPEALLQQIRQRGASIDKDFEAQIASMPNNDEVLAEAMQRMPTVLGFFNQSSSGMGLPETKAGFAVFGDDPKPLLNRISSSVMSLPPFREAAVGQGSVSLTPQNDELVRAVPMFSTDGEHIYPAMALEALRVVLGENTYILKTNTASGDASGGRLAMTEFKIGDFVVPVDQNGDMLIYYSKNDPELYVPAVDLLTGDPEKIRPLIEGHLVFVGTSAAGLRDIRVTTLGENVPGVYVHTQIVDQILSGEFLTRPDWATGAEIATMLIATGLIVYILPLVGALISAVFGACLSIIILALSWLAFQRYGMLLDPLFPMATGLAIFLVSNILLFSFAEREKRFVRGAFQRYLARDLLETLEKNPESLKLGGEIREMTLMFMDVRGFTPISETLSPEQVVTFLNTLFSPLSQIIQQHQGAIDKYIGDSIMAFWNAPLDVPNHPKKAAHAALTMLKCVDELNESDSFGFRTSNAGIGDVRIGIGLNTGEGCVGNMGSSDRFDYSVIGDAVNMASRIESSCKEVGWPILLSARTASECLELALLEAGTVSLKGKRVGTQLFALIGDEAMAETQEFKQLKEYHRQFRNALSDGDIEEAESAKRDCLSFKPVDLSSFYNSALNADLYAQIRKGMISKPKLALEEAFPAEPAPAAGR